MNKVTGTRCDDCIHRSVCCHKNDFNDICKAVADASVHKINPDGKTMSIKKVINYDILSKIIINCRYFQKEVPTPRCQTNIPTLTNPCNISTSTTTDYIFG